MPSCIVKGCRHKSGQKILYPDVVLHSFPNNIHMIKNWMLQTGQDFGDIDAFAEKILKGNKTASFRMCSRHFTRDSYMAKGSKITLKPNAVPTIFDTLPPAASVPSLISLPTAKRMRVEDEAPSTSATIVRIVSKLVTVQTQTDDRILKNDPWVNRYNCPVTVSVATQTDAPAETDDMKTETSSRSQEVKIWHADKDYLYPVYDAPIKTSMKTSVKQTTKEPTKQEEAGDALDPRGASFGLCPGRPFQESGSLNTNTEQGHLVKQKKYLVFEDSLNSLLTLVRCQHSQSPPCEAPVSHIEKKVDGSLLTVHLTCLKGHKSLVWNAQPVFGNVSIGNVLMASAIFQSGSALDKALQTLNVFGIPAISSKTYHEYQKAYVFPAVDSQWRLEEGRIKKTFAGKSVALAAGRQVINLGHSSKYCMYSMMDVISEKIVSFKIKHFGPEDTLWETEKQTFQDCLDQLINEKLDIRIIATNQHVGIRKLMEIKYPHIEHQLDIWQLCKCLGRKLEEASKKKNCSIIADWIPAITNHLWWSSQTCNQNVDVFMERWKSALFHIANVHSFPSLKFYKKCQHARISETEQQETNWIPFNHPAHEALVEIISDPILLDDIAKAEKFCHTRYLEAFYSKIEKYQSGHLSSVTDDLHVRTALAALSYNRDLDRGQPSVGPLKSPLDAENPHKIVFPEERRDLVLDTIQEDAAESHFLDMSSQIVKILLGELEHKGS
ncbi:mitochondrial potassium channel isoform X1 [Xenopus tropicalis]|uniref:Coiled-coil domain containing 51 n=1 Tax=Xenopus tropicalis TaxID=8364 RepID=A0A803JG92_XENTR|nr:mitochondrial potassium channel isoform X1 [Xenopus tropicalis]XP_012816085.1 mitochondrial potassium channel isoform X1 [Xenopus tropicalis]XP_031755721.1 mitochondrial potassium channel isoform X1 [Xenopus tropicalis]|eukprot:XP_012816084.1 PREDICTED: coiled-coil domain-containing protein 51 isoform X2 [Xenopus tropicalis]